jgi:hypothetical protein
MSKAYKPYYPIKDVKLLIKANHFHFNDNALEDGYNCFRWGPEQMSATILRLNDRWYLSDPSKNHFYKTEPHSTIPNTKMDYYKIQNGLEGNKIYTHLYIHPTSNMLVISSFKEL